MGSTSVWVFWVIARLLIGHHEVFPRQHTKKIEIQAVTSWGLVLEICSLQVVALPLRKEPFIQADRGTNMASSAIYIYIPIGSMCAIYGNIYHQYTPFMLAYIAYMDPMGYRYTHLQRIQPYAMCSVAVTIVPFRDVSPLLADCLTERGHPRQRPWVCLKIGSLHTFKLSVFPLKLPHIELKPAFWDKSKYHIVDVCY